MNGEQLIKGLPLTNSLKSAYILFFNGLTKNWRKIYRVLHRMMWKESGRSQRNKLSALPLENPDLKQREVPLLDIEYGYYSHILVLGWA